ncbi:MAG: tRNA dihydrouridine synthase DusB [Firmicutes bacterium]|nr:tRNA dihydrouridine synthase DusB [Bacillota bacterium]
MKIGNIKVDNKIFLAPMAGVTDLAFRLICKEYGVGLVYSEMVSAKGMYYGDKKTENLLKSDYKERPLAVQIFGSEPDIMSKVVKDKLNKRNDFDIIDINMGCPAPKIVKNGDGSALMKKPKLVQKVIKAVVSASNKPVTVKIRAGWDSGSINAVEIAKIAETNGAKAVAVHGRTREEYYSGFANWDIIKKVKENINIPVIGNGDLFKPEDVVKMFKHTKCDAVMIGRGSRGNPWIFKRTLSLINDNEMIDEPNFEDRIKMCIKHLDLLCRVKREDIAVKEMRKHIGWYIKGLPNSSTMRGKLNTFDKKEELKKELYNYLNIIKY